MTEFLHKSQDNEANNIAMSRRRVCVSLSNKRMEKRNLKNTCTLSPHLIPISQHRNHLPFGHDNQPLPSAVLAAPPGERAILFVNFCPLKALIEYLFLAEYFNF